MPAICSGEDAHPELRADVLNETKSGRQWKPVEREFGCPSKVCRAPDSACAWTE